MEQLIPPLFAKRELSHSYGWGSFSVKTGSDPRREERAPKNREYPLSELKDFRLEELLSGARLTAKTRGGEYVFLTAMSNFRKNSVLLFIKYLNKLRRGEIAEIEVYWN